ncbi:MAG: GNAT family N-acetyltransferase [Anaerolineae bacterium]|nr:GNAT family N-acetyltransferase [Anaerolineae bacterium]
MNLTEIRDLYDQQQRRDAKYPGTRREITPYTVRLVDMVGDASGIFYTRLDEANADAIIEQEIAFFRAIGCDFEWKLYSHDTPADLLGRLERRGFEIGEPDAIMVLEIEHAPELLLRPVSADVRPITDPEKLSDVLAVLKPVWDENFDGLMKHLESDLRENPDFLNIFVIDEDNVPVSVAWMNFLPENAFAGLWGGSTLPEYRGKGFYTTLLAARIQRAQQRGCRFVTVDAGPMSRPILEKLGFQQIATAYACVWHHNRPRAG